MWFLQGRWASIILCLTSIQPPVGLSSHLPSPALTRMKPLLWFHFHGFHLHLNPPIGVHKVCSLHCDSVPSPEGPGQGGPQHPDWEQLEHGHPSATNILLTAQLSSTQKANLRRDSGGWRVQRDSLFHRWGDWTPKQKQEAPDTWPAKSRISYESCRGHYCSTLSLESSLNNLLCDLRKMINLPQPQFYHQ